MLGPLSQHERTNMVKIPLPNFTQAPNTFFDDIAKTLKEGELRVLLVIMRQTFGWHKAWDRISLSQLERKTGMCRDAVNNALKSLIKLGLIDKKKTGINGIEKCWYSLVVEEHKNEDEMPGDGEEPIENSNNFDQSSKTTPTSRLKRPTKETPTKELKEINKEKSIRPHSVRPIAAPITLDAERQEFVGLTQEDVKRWEKTFPAVNVRKEVMECVLWALSAHRKNYRKSLDTWMRNVNQKHTTPFTPSVEQPMASSDDIDKNKAYAIWLESSFDGKGGTHYAIIASHKEITFVMPENQSLTLNYIQKHEEFRNKCQTPMKRMQIKEKNMPLQ